VTYLDNNATTPVWPEVAEAIQPFLASEWGNPSSSYRFGARNKRVINDAREHVAELVGADPDDVIFTSGATEANSTALHAALATQPGKRHVITSGVEHSSVLGYCQALQTRGFEVTFLAVDGLGQLDLDNLEANIRPDTAIVSVMWANNETGVIFPIREISSICRKRKVLFHCDAVQAVGKIAVDFRSLPIDYLSLSGHKLGAPKGIGALVIQNNVPFSPLLVGGKQEGGRRGGTESVPLIVGLGKACELARSRGLEAWKPIAALRDRLEAQILSLIPDAYRNGSASNRLPNTLNFGIRGVDSDGLVAFLDGQDVCVSSGSACMENSIAPSHVVMAMTNDHQRANEALRVSLWLTTTWRDLEPFTALLANFVAAVH
jgi:cysteine desulfurase